MLNLKINKSPQFLNVFFVLFYQELKTIGLLGASLVLVWALAQGPNLYVNLALDQWCLEDLRRIEPASSATDDALKAIKICQYNKPIVSIYTWGNLEFERR